MENTNNIFEIPTNRLKPIQGRVLLSEPFLNDYYFKRSVVLLVDNGNEGSLGIIINKPLSLKLNEVITDFEKSNINVYLGGPIKTENIYFIHRCGDIIEGSIEIEKGVYWGGNVKIVRDMLINNVISNDDIRFYLGYSGWVPKQLEDEITKNSWAVSNISEEEIFNKEPLILWDSLVVKLGGNYKHWIKFPVNPAAN